MADDVEKPGLTLAHERIADIVDEALAKADLDGAIPPQPTGDDGPEPQEPPPPDVSWDLVRACAIEPETDIGNARRFLTRHGETVLSIEGLGWAVHDGRRWAMDFFQAEVRPLAHQTVELIRLEGAVLEARPEELEAIEQARLVFGRQRELRKKGHARNAGEDLEMISLDEIVGAGKRAAAALSDRQARRQRYGKTSASTGKMDNMLSEARVYRSRPVKILDTDPLALNVQNGTLRFAKLGAGDDERWMPKLHPHQKTDLISKLADVEWKPRADCPVFKAFLQRIVPDPKVRAFLQRWFGYCLTALTSEQVFVFLYGQGSNGKSTLIDIICRILGDYTTTVPFETLAGDARGRGSEATPELVRVPGARLVRASEPETGMKFRESMVKSLTSGEPIMIRRMREEFIEVYPSFKLNISGNHRPDIRGGDDGIWRRVLMVPFSVQIPPEERDKGLADKLWGERSGILNWLVLGVLSYLSDGLQVPDAVRAATDDYREQSDPYNAFLSGACKVTGDDADIASPGDLHNAFVIFCKKQGFYPVGISTFNKAMPERAAAWGFRKAKTMGLSIYRGLYILEEFKPENPQTPWNRDE